MAVKDIKQTLHLTVLFSYIIQLASLFYINLIKQLNPLLFLLLALNIFFSSASFANQLQPFNNTADIYSVIQDKKGFLWLSGQNGLYRYDGSQVINFSNNKKDWPIPFNWINNASVKGDELILATETKGLWLFNTNTGITNPIKIKSESNTFYRAIHHTNSIYAISMAPQHLYRFDIASGETTLLMKNIDNTVLLSSNNRIYFNDEEKLYSIDSTKKNKRIEYLNGIEEKIVASTSTKGTLIIASKNNLYKLSDDSTITKEKTKFPISALAISNDHKSFFSVDISGKIVKRELTTLKKLNNSFPTVEKSKYQALLNDSSGVLWLVNNRSVRRLTENDVKNHPAIFDTKYNALETEVYNNQLYLGSYGKGVYTPSPLKHEQIKPVKNINKYLQEKSLKINDLLSINGLLFIATFDGLWIYNKKHTQRLNLTFRNVNLSHLLLLKLVHFNNLLYIATDGQGLIVYDLTKKLVIKHIDTKMGLSSGEVIDILPLVNGDIWLATASGIDIIGKNSAAVNSITQQASAKFTSIIQVGTKFFSGTKGDGIFVYNQQGQLLNHFAKGINLSFMALIDGYIFASAKPGLYKINPRNYQISMIPNTESYNFTDTPLAYKNSIFIANSSGILQLPKRTSPSFNPKIYISKTTVSGESYLLNNTINIKSGNDVVTLDLASLDYRPGITKQYRYTLDGNTWNQVRGNQLTLTGLASGHYHIEIMATNSLGQWSNYKAYTEINVAFPWYWTPQIRLLYAFVIFCIVSLTAWLLYLRSRSIKHIHNILKNDISNYSKTSTLLKRNLTTALTLLTENEINKSKQMLQECVDELNEQQKSPEPSSLNGNLLSIAIPFLAEYLQKKYQTKMSFQFEINEEEFEYELRADIYKVVFEAITSAILKGNGRVFKVVIQSFKDKIWLNISDDSQSFINFNSKINMDLSMYYIRQIANKYNGSVNTFNEQGNGSQLVLSLPKKRQNY